MTVNQEAIKTWLLGYAWLGSTEERAAEVECIMAQREWEYLDARVEHLLGQRSGERTVEEDLSEAEGMALSGLYECHDGPHLPTCPREAS